MEPCACQDECGPNVSTGISDLEAAERGIPISDGRANLAVPPPGVLAFEFGCLSTWENRAQGSNGDGDDWDDNYRDFSSLVWLVLGRIIFGFPKNRSEPLEMPMLMR